MNTNIKNVENNGDILKCLTAMNALRPQLNPENIVDIITGMMARGYHLAYIEVDGIAAAAAGFRYTEHLAWGKVIYIDDLTTHPDHRKKGYAKILLDHVFQLAASSGCDQVHLDSGCIPQRYDAHRLYLKYGFNITSHHFSIKIK